MLATYESIDLGVVSRLTKASETPGTASLLDLVQGNHPVFYLDPIYNDTIYVSHAFGVHALYLEPLLRSLAAILREGSEVDGGSAEPTSLEGAKHTDVQPVLLTFSVEQQCVGGLRGVGALLTFAGLDVQHRSLGLLCPMTYISLTVF